MPIFSQKPPLSTHPWFPALVALWFAALLGLSSLAAAPGLLERAVVAAGIDRLIPAAAPPLGATARLLLALGLAGLGAVIGLALGLRLAAAGRAKLDAGRQFARETAEAEADGADHDELPLLRNSAPEPPRSPLQAHDELVLPERAPEPELAELPQAIEPAPELPEIAAAYEPCDEPVAALEAAPEPEAPAEVPPPLSPVPEGPRHALADIPLAKLGTVQMVERLAFAIQARDARAAERAEPGWEFDSAEPDELSETAAEARAREILARRAPKPRPALEPDEDAFRAAAAAAAAIAADDEDEEPETDESEVSGYSSLLAIGPSVARTERVAEASADDEVEPVVVFPGQAARAAAAARQPGADSPDPLDPAEAERALGEALASLQRFSGKR